MSPFADPRVTGACEDARSVATVPERVARLVFVVARDPERVEIEPERAVIVVLIVAIAPERVAILFVFVTV